MAPNPELSYLHRVVMEIMETEHTYVQDLHSIVEGYLAHIIDTADLPIIPEHVCALFGNIEDIYEFNSTLLQELEQCKNDPVAIARCFVLKRDYFEIYSQYCTNYPNSVAALTECMRNKTLLQFFMERQEMLKHPLPLGSYLLKPVQRILKYHLLLQEIAKHFDPDDDDGSEVVEEAINTMTEVAWYINTMKRKHEHAVRLQEVQSLLINWRGPDLTTYGELVLEGTFRFHHTKNNRTLFLFERVLLITKRRGENFIYKTHISCSMLMLMEGEKDSLCFSFSHYKHPKHPHTVQARNTEEKKLWTHHIKRLILENHHTIIPQKAKEVILDMDPMYEKYRFNWTERKKKTQSDDFTHTRKSEFNRQMIENSTTMLKQSVSEGELRQNHTTLSSTSDTWQAVSVKDKRLCCINTEDATYCEIQDEEEEGSESDDVIMEDFSNSMILCWSFRAKALLQLSMDEECQVLGDTQLSEQEDTHVCDDPNTNKISGLEQDMKSTSDVLYIGHCVDPVNIEEESDQCREKDAALNQDGHSSEEEVEENCAGSQNHSILPSSVLDKAEVIAEHFITNARRSSVTADELRSPQRVPQQITASKNTTANCVPLSPRDETGTESERIRRRNSILSKKEQLLIDKIRNYYENAEQDEGFSLKRRASLTFIPSGLVRTSVKQFTKTPHAEPHIKPPNTQTWPLTSSPTASDSNTKPDEARNGFSTEMDGSASHRSETLTEERFRSSVEMIKVWEEMENERTGSERENKFRHLSQLRGTGSLPQRFSRNKSRVGGQQLKTTEDLNTITEESPVKPGKEEEKGRTSTETAAWSPTKSFTKHLQSREPANQLRRRVPVTRGKTGNPNLALSLTACDPTSPHGSSVSNVTILSPELSKSPALVEGFPWPDIRKLRSMYTSLDRPSLTPFSPGCRTDNRASRVPRAESLDRNLFGADWTNVQNGDYCISAQATLPSNRTVTVLEKVKTHVQPGQSHTELQIEEKTFMPSVSDRRRLYEDLDKAAVRTKPNPRNKDSKTNTHSRVSSKPARDIYFIFNK